MAAHNARDNSFKLIFGNHQLFVDFLRDFIHIELLKEVRPEDVEDISERFLPLFQENRDSDTVKRINLKGTPLFVIAILEHESKVNHRSSFKMLQYICLVLDAWEKDMEREKPGSSRKKDFMYPPVLPIVFYDGKYSWTAEKNFLERTNLNKAFEKYIPKFEYELVNLNDYSEESIKNFGDALSVIMLFDKLRGGSGEKILMHLSKGYIEKLHLQIPDSLTKLLSDVILVLLDNSGFDLKEAEILAAQIDKPEWKGYKGMFEAFVESIRKEREKAVREGREEVARNALAEGASYDFIQKITGLDIESIKSLSQN